MTKRNLYRNNDKAVAVGNSFWDKTAIDGLTGIVANLNGDGYLETTSGHRFINLSCCSYLDFDSHPAIIDGAIAALKKYGVLDHCISRIRIQIPALLELEDHLSRLFRANVISSISASAATAGLLPLIASGHLCGGQRPIMVFDKHCHFSMNLYKPVCADETEVLTAPHNDMNFVEDACKNYIKVAYVCDGTYSMGGHTNVEDLLALQEKYGLFIYFDDSHSLSVVGENGEGYVRSRIREVNDQTIIVATLNKAFGASGGAIMHGLKDITVLERFGGPLAWSQPMNTAAIGGAQASAQLHNTDELKTRQKALKHKIELFDSIIVTEQQGQDLPIKLFKTGDETAIECGKKLFEEGFYVSPVFFPIVPRGGAGLRVMLRAGIPDSEILRLCKLLNSFS